VLRFNREEYVAHQLRVHFQELTAAEASIAANQLAADLDALRPDVDISLVRVNEATQDLGTAVVLVLGAPAVVVVARGIANFLTKRGTTARIETPNGCVVLTGDAVSSQQLVDIVKALEASTGGPEVPRADRTLR
jgi:hypothetical protein